MVKKRLQLDPECVKTKSLLKLKKKNGITVYKCTIREVLFENGRVGGWNTFWAISFKNGKSG